MHYLTRTILNVSYAVRRSQRILMFQHFLNTKEEGQSEKSGSMWEEKQSRCMSVRALKNQCEPEPRVKVVPIKYASITPLNFPLSKHVLTRDGTICDHYKLIEVNFHYWDNCEYCVQQHPKRLLGNQQ